MAEQTIGAPAAAGRSPTPNTSTTNTLTPNTSTTTAAKPRQRLSYLDNLRIVLTVLVVIHHVVISYGNIPLWYYHEKTTDPFSGLLDLVVGLNQLFFMGFFFLISGYFVPASYERKGAKQFMRDRLIRLGIPLVGFLLLLRPLANFSGYSQATQQYGDFPYPLYYLLSWDPGPLWFVEVLLVFTIGYVLLRKFRDSRAAVSMSGIEPRPAVAPSGWAIVGYALALGVATFAWRIFVPVWAYVPFLGLPTPSYLPQYASMFVLGVYAYRRGWFAKLSVRAGWYGLAAAVVSGAAAMLPPFIMGPAATGGFTWQSAYVSVMQSIFCVGIIVALLVWFRQRFNQQKALGRFMAPQAFAVYVIHAPILVGVGFAISGLALPLLVKVAVAAAISIVACWTIAWLIRRIPGVTRVL